MAREQLRRIGVPAVFKPDDHGTPEQADIFCAAGNPDKFGSLDILAESEHFRLVTTPFPKAAGQVLVVTKAHMRTFADVPVTWHRELRRMVDFGSKFQREMYGKQTCLREQGSSVRQSVPHAHLHLLPVSGQVVVPRGHRINAGDWFAVARYKLRAGEYYYMEYADTGLLIPHTADAVRDAEWAVCEAIPGRWNDEKSEPEGDRSPKGRELLGELCENWKTWTGRSEVRDLARAGKITFGPAKTDTVFGS